MALPRSSVTELQWGHDEGVVEGVDQHVDRSAGRPGFNGATTKVSWKAASLSVPVAGRCRMLQWGHDEGVVEGRQHGDIIESRQVSFNGATTKASWKAPLEVVRGVVHPQLQWGHDEGVVEGAGHGGSSVRPLTRFNGATTKVSWKADLSARVIGDDVEASMGPRRRCRGRRTDRGLALASVVACFNGATTKVSWKAYVATGRSLTSSIELQWGHDEGVVEGSTMVPVSPVVTGCFNGATTKVSWKAHRVDRRPLADRPCFNGATTKVSWKAGMAV